ncbi:outer membrane beta-barrel protein [Owenweeksia hongkongensis]|uniref:outer membrane beta-barrel protein n=1 Tax=Owenweeksia hongkongensis TaxID=253245 RepID=UPI003A9383B8
MSWIDKKYKNHFKEQKYSEGMKQRGWDSMQSLLDKQMPVTPPKTMMSNPLYLTGLAAVVVTVIGIPFFITNQPKDTRPAKELRTPTTIQMDPADGISTRPDDKELYPSDFSTESLNSSEVDVAESTMDNAQQTVSDIPESKEQKHSEEAMVVTPIVEKPVANTAPGEYQTEEAGSEVVVANEVAKESVKDAVVISEEKEIETLSDEDVMIPVTEISIAVADEALIINEEQKLQEEERTPTAEAVLVKTSTNEIEEETDNRQEILVSESTIADIASENTEQTVVEPEDEVLALAETNDAEELKEESLEEEIAESASNIVMTKAAHLAFLEAEEDLPIPDLLTFSKERFALSVWGGYLFTGNVLSGGNESDINKRKASEKPIYTTPTGVGLDYFVNKNWTVGVGLGWAEYGEDVDYTLYDVTSSIETVAFDGRYDSPSNYPNIISIDSTRVIDTVNQGHWNYHLSYRNDDSTANSYSGRNTFRYIEVPLTVGYRFGTGRIKPWVKAGVIVGLPIQASYRYPQFGTSTYTEGGSKASLSAIQYSGLLQVGADFYINRALSVRLNALGSYQINSMLANDGVRQRYYRVGASVGVAYNF